jgi:hypothetical protein
MIDILKSILSDLQKYKRDREDVMSACINDRLSSSLESYYNELYSNLNYLVFKDGIRVLKEYNKISGD